MTPEDKILSFESAPEVFEKLREEGKKIVQCHGTFDLIHPGHVYHFEEAKALGDVLVVTFTSEKHVNKGPGRPFFNDELRGKTLGALEYVDYVVPIPFPAAVEAIECVRPHVYCKGKEYEDQANDVTGNIAADVNAVTHCGGEVHYVGSVVFSSSRILNKHFQSRSDPVRTFCEELSGRVSPDELRKTVDSFSDLKILVIGDTIFDRYSALYIQGLTSKNRILSGRFLSEDTQAGGALAVFRHLREFTPNARFISLVGTEPWVGGELRQYLSADEDSVIRSPDFTTIVKQRFIEPRNEDAELPKLFAVNYIDANHPGEEIRERVLEEIEKHLPAFDYIMTLDFGHGLLQNPIRRFLEGSGKFMALNCQTNSNNHGFNIINQKYRRCDLFSLDQAEITLAYGERDLDYTKALKGLLDEFGSSYAWLTRGAVETVGITGEGEETVCPPFESEIVDAVGAGDAFFSLASLAAFRSLPIDLSTFLGQLAGAQAVRIVGNAEHISKARLLKSGMNLLNF